MFPLGVTPSPPIRPAHRSLKLQFENKLVNNLNDTKFTHSKLITYTSGAVGRPNVMLTVNK